MRNLYELKKLIPFAEDNGFRDEWCRVKLANKMRLAKYIESTNGITVNVHSIFDCQVKRIHEYKRQLLNALHVIALYNRIKSDPRQNYTPRTVILGGKAAPGYFIAKLVIKLINSVADVVNNDPVVSGSLRVVFLENYRVSLAEKDHPGGRPFRANIHSGYGGFWHWQHEICTERRFDHRHAGRR